MSRRAEPSPPSELQEHQKTTMPTTKTMMMKTFRSTMPPQLPPLESEQAMNVAPYGHTVYGQTSSSFWLWQD
jgi:hypothetical protein